MNKLTGKIVFSVFLAAAMAVLCTCGMEDYIYLYPVQVGNINVRLTEEATLRLPSPNSSEASYFTNFSIFYRIYISGVLESSEINSPQLMNTISSSLYSDYNSIYPSTSSNSNNTVNTSAASLFSARRYYELELEEENINSFLDENSQGKVLVINFPSQPGSIPSLTLDSNTRTLWRSTGDGTFSPRPSNRYFVNTSELNDSNNAIPTINADVANQTGISGPRYTYVSMYIVKVGRDSSTLSNIYSAPTFIGVLRLPD
jgi:hypothetical protein